MLLSLFITVIGNMDVYGPVWIGFEAKIKLYVFWFGFG